MIEWLVFVAALVATGLAFIRWLRVAQREHYEPGRVRVFARWWMQPAWLFLAVGFVAAISLVMLQPLLAVPLVIVVGAGPRGLGLRGRSSALAWTRRLKTLAAATMALALMAVVAVASVTSRWWIGAVVVAAGAHLLVDLGCAVTAPFERRTARRFVDQARARLEQIRPTVIALTGSYGKTTVKGYVRHLIEGTRSVVASPASFNNTAGLSRTVNEQLSAGTEVFIAEMGAYGRGEIRSLCSWVRPSITAIVAIGPVHLERYGTLDRIVEAKSEILDGAERVVLNVDAHGLAAVADATEARGVDVTRVSARPSSGADIVVTPEGDRLVVTIHGQRRADIDAHGRHPTNVAAAIGLALAADVPVDELVGRLDSLPGSEHRQQVVTAPSGVVVIDNTFNSNPASAATSLELLARHATPEHKAVLVTPGMIELGDLAHEENERFAAAAAAVCTDVVIVGRTNRAALRAGAADGRATVHEMATRDDAVAWVRAELGPGDVVLYENDLPDHYA